MDDLIITRGPAVDWAQVAAELRFKKMIERLCEKYPEVCNGVIEENPFKIDPWPELTAGSAIATILGPVGFPNPDGDGPDPNGPFGPVIRDSLVAMSMLQLSSAISDRSAAFEVQKVAAGLVQRHAEQLQEIVAQQ